MWKRRFLAKFGFVDIVNDYVQIEFNSRPWQNPNVNSRPTDIPSIDAGKTPSTSHIRARNSFGGASAFLYERLLVIKHNRVFRDTSRLNGLYNGAKIDPEPRASIFAKKNGATIF